MLQLKHQSKDFLDVLLSNEYKNVGCFPGLLSLLIFIPTIYNIYILDCRPKSMCLYRKNVLALNQSPLLVNELVENSNLHYQVNLKNNIEIFIVSLTVKLTKSGDVTAVQCYTVHVW